MSKYGFKIRNYQAGSIFEYNLGVRDRYEFKPAMLTNSLFQEFLVESGLEVWGDDFTRDIICIEFNYGGTSWEEQLKRINMAIDRAIKSGDVDKVKSLFDIKEAKEKTKDLFQKISKEEIREIFYTNGVSIDYFSRKNRLQSVIHYKFLYRTPGKAKKGSCMFIRDELYDKAIDFLRMGLELPYDNAPIVEISAYSSLVTSTIEDKIEIDPKNILILKDVDSFFTTNAISVEINEKKECLAVQKENYRLKNTLFDGQALIDSNIFPDWGNGYILLRHHFCKMASFKTNLQLFFQDYYGDEYETATVLDMFGNEHLVKDIQLVTTDNAMKWIKFDVSYEYWCERVNQNGNMFGIVKTAHESKLGSVQKMSYQMVNALDESIMQEVIDESYKYIVRLKRDTLAFLDYLKKNVNYYNDFDVLLDLVNHNPEFIRSRYFRDRKGSIIQNYINRFRNGKILQNADNLVLVGSPYAMLLHCVGEDVELDDTFKYEEGTIQCFTTRFADGEYLAEFRSPFNSKNNMGYLHNVYHEKFFKYFDFGKQIIAVNVINTDFQDRNNGLRNWVGSGETQFKNYSVKIGTLVHKQ